MGESVIRMANQGKFDNKVADDISLQMLKLRIDGIAKVSEGPLRTQ